MTINVPGSTILGYDGDTAALLNSDPMFAVAGVNYAGQARQHEWTTNNPGGNGDYYELVSPDTAVIRMAVADCCVDHGRLFVACLT